MFGNPYTVIVLKYFQTLAQYDKANAFMTMNFNTLSSEALYVFI